MARTIVSFDPSFEQVEVMGFIASKVVRYNWRKPGAEGVFQMIDKAILVVDRAYQRSVSQSKILAIAADWKWESCGAISVMKRQDFCGYMVIDGQNRTLAAWKRSDIKYLPCMVFESQGVKHEASSFVEINTNRKPVLAYDKFKAKLVAGDAASIEIANAIEENGFVLKANSDNTKTITCIAACQSVYHSNPGKFRLILKTACDLAIEDNCVVSNILLQGLSEINKKIKVVGGIVDPKLNKRLHEVGAQALVVQAKKESYRAGKGGAKIWANGMLQIINRKRGVEFTFLD
jgi:hypothetical protein